MDVITELLQPVALLSLVLGTLAGLVIGAIPGLSVTMAIALLIPVTFTMDTVPGLVLLISVYVAGVYGGSVAAILLRTPGTPAAAATAMDGYPMTQQGKGAKAIRIATVGSVVGGLFSGLVLIVAAPLLSRVSLMFGAAEYFLIAVFALVAIGGLAGGSFLLGVAAALIGLLIGVIGMDTQTGVTRYTGGMQDLQSGIQLIPAMIGLFSISQVFRMMYQDRQQKLASTDRGTGDFSSGEFRKLVPTFAKSSTIGVFVGVLPGAGENIGAWMAYNEARRSSKDKSKFGKGAIEGVAAPETANNSVVGAALIPTLTLGVPGSAATAVLLGGLIIQGMAPGHELFTRYATETYSMISAYMVATVLMGAIGLLLVPYVVRLTTLPPRLVALVIMVLAVVGTYSFRNSYFDVIVMVIFGVFGWFIERVGINPAPVILGMILGPMAESGFRRSLVMAGDQNLAIFYLSDPLRIALISMILIVCLVPLLRILRARGQKRRITSSTVAIM
ncbi:tripartite tricarboxylate transporter permease [Nesterenkonia muleiensis]|uniref:tripartite tricarboxylate transporter permease n=1 Tax=Nesterenkonia muleiensis TaxID=2282648 RepID=UPI000E766104|nr:tripartite tricarboxylate transporter permease [Nesterenkonia muleiensis]